VSRNWNIYLFC